MLPTPISSDVLFLVSLPPVSYANRLWSAHTWTLSCFLYKSFPLPFLPLHLCHLLSDGDWLPCYSKHWKSNPVCSHLGGFHLFPQLQSEKKCKDSSLTCGTCECSINEQRHLSNGWVYILLNLAEGDISNMVNIMYYIGKSLTHRYNCSLPACIYSDCN